MNGSVSNAMLVNREEQTLMVSCYAHSSPLFIVDHAGGGGQVGGWNDTSVVCAMV